MRNSFSATEKYRSFHILIIEHHDWLFPEESISRPLLKFLSEGNYDVVCRGNIMFCFNLDYIDRA